MVEPPDFYLPRKGQRDIGLGQSVVEDFGDYRGYPAFVVLAEPGAGKTQLFVREAEASGGFYVTARNFTLCDAAMIAGRTVFIDGLDERRAAGGGVRALDEIREHLVRLGRPPFRLSCREADWLGESDARALSFISPSGQLVVFHLEPLNNHEITQLLRRHGIKDVDAFVARAERDSLGALLRNPQTLLMLVKAVSQGWPRTRAEVFERGCHELALERNDEHRAAAAVRPEVTEKALLQAAGYLCAVMLLSGKHAYRRGGASILDPADDRIALTEVANPTGLPLEQALKTNLFVRGGMGVDADRMPLHRSVAEYVAGSYLGERIERHALSVRRVLAACTGEDGGVVSDLRGLCAWLAAASSTARSALIDSDPLGLVLYGDVSTFSPHDKRRLWASLKREAERYPGFRSEDRMAAPFGALATKDMQPILTASLNRPVRTDADQVFLDCVLDAIQHGDPMPAMLPRLRSIARDTRYWGHVRLTAIEAIERISSDPAKDLKGLLKEIQAGQVKDPEDQLLAYLLRRLYLGRHISASNLLEYLHQPKSEHLIGDYYHFWTPDLAKTAPTADLPILLEAVIARRPLLERFADSILVRSLMGELLAATLEAHGDLADDPKLLHWLSLGRDSAHLDRLDDDDKKVVSGWLAARPERYKAIVRSTLEQCRGPSVAQSIRLVIPPVYDASEPADMVEWYLNAAALETEPLIAEYYFSHGMFALMRRHGGAIGERFLQAAESWVASYPKFGPWYEPFVSRPVHSYEREHWRYEKERKQKAAMRAADIVGPVRAAESALLSGAPQPSLMHQLSWAYNGRYYESQGDDPDERLSNFLGGDAQLVEATKIGLSRVLDRVDLPELAEIIEVQYKGKTGSYHYLREPALVAMEIRYAESPAAALSLPQDLLEKLCAFHLTLSPSEDPDWLNAVLKDRPEAMSAALVPYVLRSASSNKEHLSGVWNLGYDSDYAAVARLAIGPLLDKFPIRTTSQVVSRILFPLIHAGLKYLPTDVLKARIASKLSSRSLDPYQRLAWLASGLLADSGRYLKRLITFVSVSKARRTELSAFLSAQLEDQVPNQPTLIEQLPEEALDALIRSLAPGASGSMISHDHSRLVRHMIETLEAKRTVTALNRFDALVAERRLVKWHNSFRAAMNAIRVERRKLSLEVMSPRGASAMLTDDRPASAGDLAAVATDSIRDLAHRIRNDQTSDYKQYWDGGRPRIENDCRDVLLSQLRQRLARYGAEGTQAAKEAHVAHEQRADIMVTYGSQYEIPIEAKREDYRKHRQTIWTAIRSQLAERYVLYPNAHGNGIYLVFWFGRRVPASPEGTKPITPAELEDALRALLMPSDGRIEVIVLDCSLPMAREKRIPHKTARGRTPKTHGPATARSRRKIGKPA
jgi:hypothetical protein